MYKLIPALLILLITRGNLFAQPADVVVVNKIKSNANLLGSLAFLDFSSGKVIKIIPVGNEPHFVIDPQ